MKKDIFSKFISENRIVNDVIDSQSFSAYIRSGTGEEFVFPARKGGIVIFKYDCGMFYNMEYIDTSISYVYAELVKLGDAVDAAYIENY